MRSANVSMQPIGFFLISLILLALTGCGGGGGGQPGSPEGPNVGTGSLQIFNPTDSGAYQTNQPTVALGGNSFTPADSSCNAAVGVLPPGYQVSWSNNSTGATGNASSNLNCLLMVFTHWDIDSVPLAMGANSITVTATDGAGNIGRDTIVVTRVP